MSEESPTTGLREAITRREALSEAMTVLVKEYEKQVPHTRVEAIQISRVTTTGRLGTKRHQITVLPRIILTD